MSDSVRPHRQQPTRLPHPWDSPGKNTGVGCHFLLQCMKVKVMSFSRVRLLATPWTTAYQAPPSMGFSRQEYWSGLPLPSPPHLSRKPYTESASFLCGIHSLSFLETEIQCNSRWHVVSQRTMIFCLFCRRWKQKLLDGTSGKDFYPSILPALFGVWIWWLELQEP